MFLGVRIEGDGCWVGDAVVLVVLALFWIARDCESMEVVGGIKREGEFVYREGSYMTKIISIDPLLIFYQ